MLFKWQLSCETKSAVRLPSAPECLTAILMYSAEWIGTSKSVVLPGASLADSNEDDEPGSGALSQDQALHVWILNNNIKYSSTKAAGVKTAMRVLYRTIPREEADKMVEAADASTAEVNLPREAANVVYAQLQATNALLPRGQRLFGIWTIGHLDRWDAR